MTGAKKIFTVAGVVLALLVAIMIVAPFFIDLNKTVRPILVKTIEEKLNAQIEMGNISLSLFGSVNFKIEFLKIIKDKLVVDISDITMVMPYSVLKKNLAEWTQNIKMEILADEVSLNNRKLVVSNIKTDFLSSKTEVRLKNTTYEIFEGQGTSYAQMDFSSGIKGLFEFEVRDGEWPVDKLKSDLEKRAPNIPKAKKMISDLNINDEFKSLKGSVSIENGITNIQFITMDIPESKADVKASGTISAASAVKINGNFILPLDNVPAELRASDGRGSIPFEVIGTVDAPRLNWEKMLELVVHAYSKDEGKKIIKKEVEKLKEKLMKNEKLKNLIKDIKF